MSAKAISAARVLVLCLLAALATNADANAQPATQAAPTVDSRYESPRASVNTFLLTMNRWLDSPWYQRDTSAESVIADVLGLEGTLERDSAVQVGERLLYIFNRLDRVEPESLPDLTESTARDLREITLFPPQDLEDAPNSLRMAAGRFPAGRIALQRSPTSGRWVFSRETVDQITDFHRAIEDLPVLAGMRDESGASLAIRLERYVPNWLRTGNTFGLSNWQWVLITVIIGAGVLTDFFVRLFLRGAWTRFARRSGTAVDTKELKHTVRPLGHAAAAAIWFIGLQFASLPTLAQGVMVIAVRVVLTLALIHAAWRITDLASEFFARQAQKTRSRIDDLLVPLLRKTLKIVVIVVGVIYVAEALDIPILPLLGGLGVGGLAFAFAAKDTIENLFGSVAVLLDRPFEVGDWVVIGDLEGTVEELGLRSTRIRTFYNSLVTVPNATLVREKVDNYGRRRYRRFKTNLSVTYATPPERIEAFCEGVRELIRLHPYTRKDYYHVWFNSMGAHSLDILLYMFFEAPDWATELRERHRLLLDIVRLANRLGIDFAFPTQTLHLHRASDVEVPGDPAAIDPVERAADRAARKLGMDTARNQTSQASWLEVQPAPVAFDLKTPGGEGEG